MGSISIKSFIEENRVAIDEVIMANNPPNAFIDDHERELWILNDESLYDWACREGVDI